MSAAVGDDGRMRAARFHGPGDIRIERIARPPLRGGAVEIRVEWCGICGTDLHEFTDGPIFCPTPDDPHPLTGETSPVVLGHEFTGIVTAIGDGVHGVANGERVAVEPRLVCGTCDACRRGLRNCCASAATIGLAGGGGGLAEYVVVDADLVFPFGELGAEAGALVEPLAVAYHAIRQSGFEAGDTVVVFGAGPIGLLVLAVLRALGAGPVVVVEPTATRRAHAEAGGAAAVLDPRVDDVAGGIAALTGGDGVAVAFDCAGVDATLQGCLDAVRAGGTVVNVAIRGRPATVDLLPLVLKEVRLVGTICYAGDHASVIELLRAGRLDVGHLVTARIGLDDLVDGGLRALLDDHGAQVKILVSPAAGATGASEETT
ncbi:(R,R)-butanediol dehydrogenase/meso-butanediol dehydrogenase/diacetyl reductase [Pseudoclavibacter chungangensis]|nr:2,3-butanediol dehydrogenase [Pseudoclavibacter chungangensis]NYJ65820.1 (R,R)-butanediol dehydrogenase/meso-butanediol dehydrogenase/diacetyl reductase [Pseudoclavibacter chungangensis]